MLALTFKPKKEKKENRHDIQRTGYCAASLGVRPEDAQVRILALVL